MSILTNVVFGECRIGQTSTQDEDNSSAPQHMRSHIPDLKSHPECFLISALCWTLTRDQYCVCLLHCQALCCTVKQVCGVCFFFLFDLPRLSRQRANCHGGFWQLRRSPDGDVFVTSHVVWGWYKYCRCAVYLFLITCMGVFCLRLLSL